MITLGASRMARRRASSYDRVSSPTSRCVTNDFVAQVFDGVFHREDMPAGVRVAMVQQCGQRGGLA